MTYQTRIIIFLITMAGTAVLLLAIFLHVTMKEIASLSASSVPLPALDEKDKQELHDLLQPAAGQQNQTPQPDNQNSIQEIPAKIISH